MSLMRPLIGLPNQQGGAERFCERFQSGIVLANKSGFVRITKGAKTLWLSNLYCVPVWIIKAEYPLPPCLPLNGMYQVHVWCNVFESHLDILMFKIQKQISSLIGFIRNKFLPPNSLFK